MQKEKYQDDQAMHGQAWHWVMRADKSKITTFEIFTGVIFMADNGIQSSFYDWCNLSSLISRQNGRNELKYYQKEEINHSMFV